MANYQRARPLPHPTPEELRVALSQVKEFVFDQLAQPPAPDHEVQSWPLMIDPEGGIWCADETCPLDCENSEIGEFRSWDDDTNIVFTLSELHAAVAEHIAARREREEDLREDS